MDTRPPGVSREQIVLRVKCDRDRLGQVDAQVLERHRQLVRTVQRAQARRVTHRRRGDADAVQVGHHGFVIHRPLRVGATPRPESVMTITLTITLKRHPARAPRA
jgi:hypothetical protein